MLLCPQSARSGSERSCFSFPSEWQWERAISGPFPVLGVCARAKQWRGVLLTPETVPTEERALQTPGALDSRGLLFLEGVSESRMPKGRHFSLPLQALSLARALPPSVGRRQGMETNVFVPLTLWLCFLQQMCTS